MLKSNENKDCRIKCSHWYFLFPPEYSRYCLRHSLISAAQLRLITDDDKVPDGYDIYSFSGLVLFLDRFHFTKIYCFQKVAVS